MKEQKLLHYCQNTKAHNGQQHGFYVKMGKWRITAKVRHLIRKKRIILARCPQCKSRDIKVGRLITGRTDG